MIRKATLPLRGTFCSKVTLFVGLCPQGPCCRLAWDGPITERQSCSQAQVTCPAQRPSCVTGWHPCLCPLAEAGGETQWGQPRHLLSPLQLLLYLLSISPCNFLPGQPVHTTQPWAPEQVRWLPRGSGSPGGHDLRCMEALTLQPQSPPEPALRGPPGQLGAGEGKEEGSTLGLKVLAGTRQGKGDAVARRGSGGGGS